MIQLLAVQSEGCCAHGCFGGSDWFQASFRPTHLKAIVNLETGKGWERNMKRERKSEREKNTTLRWTRLPGRETSQGSQKNIKEFWLNNVQIPLGCFCGSFSRV